MNLWELDEPAVDVVLRLHENRADPMTALVETSIAFGMPIEEVIASYRMHLKETGEVDDEDFPLTPLKPVSEWVYDLYKVTYLDKENGHEIRHQYITASYEGHLESDINDNWPTPAATWYTYEVVAKNVGHPRKYRGFHGMVSDDGITHGRQVAAKLGLQ